MMFEHSVRVPRHFKVVANIIKKVSTERGSVKSLLYDNKLRHFRTDVLYALITETIKHAAELDIIFEECNLLTSEPRLDPWLAKVLVTELLYGKKTLPGKSKPEQTILSYKDQFEKYATNIQATLKTEDISRPRYVRINTNLLTTSDAIRAFQDEGYRFMRCTSGSYDDYLKQIQGLTEYDFTQDYHVKTMFVFAPGTKLHDHELYLENKIILQDKATAMAVHLLAPPPGSVVMDLCAAPGNKTTQLAAFMRNQGKIYAVERKEHRYKTLCDFVEKTGSTCVQTLHGDLLELKRGDYDDVEYILLDPSCSGSGMTLSVHNYIHENRLSKLTSLQEKFLKHAMNAFPNAKKIVYSTCSLFPEENERVITNVVNLSRSKWRVQDVKELLKGQWNNIGSGMYGSIGTRCMYARPDSDLTTGFFLAVLERDKKDLQKSQNNNALKEENDKYVDNDSEELVQTSKERNKRKLETCIDEWNFLGENGEGFAERKKKKKKHKKKEATENIDVSVELEADVTISEAADEHNEQVTESSEKKRHKKKEKLEANIHESNIKKKYDKGKIENKKPSKNGDVGIELETGVVEYEALEECTVEITKKKKRKKHKNKESLEYGDIESLTTSVFEDKNVDESDINGNKKRKKRKETEVFENHRANHVSNEISHNTPKEKETLEMGPEICENLDMEYRKKIAKKKKKDKIKKNSMNL